MIKHHPITDINKIITHYSKKDGVPIKYVCTTDFNISDRPADIFYRETSHPTFGNKYFGFGLDYDTGDYIIFNADKIEKFVFGMVENNTGDLEYSQSHHDYKSFDNGNMIDGGREYTRYSGSLKNYTVNNGEMVEYVVES